MKRGDVVILDVPFPDGSGTKVRPGIIVQSDYYNRLNSTVIAAITSSRSRMVGAKTQLYIDITTPDGRDTGLRTDSVVQCNHLLTINQNLIRRSIGQLSPAQLSHVNDCLKESLDIR
jgi:mRNA interferase MazF